MDKSLLELASAERDKEFVEAYGQPKDTEEKKSQLLRSKASLEMLTDLLRTDSGPRKYPRVNMTETVHTSDFKLLFGKAVTLALQKPKEGNYIGQQLLAKTINIDGAKTVEIPVMGAIVAYQLGETQEPQDQDPSFTKNATEIKALRYGLKIEIAKDVIQYSQWDLLGLYIEQAGKALIRKKEELLFNEYTNSAFVSFDNSSNYSYQWTSGKKSDGTSLNGTYSHFDMLDQMAALAANGYNPTDILVHPMAWAIFAKDPLLRYQMMNNSMGVTMGKFNGSAESMNAAQYVPFGLNVVVSPFQTISLNSTLAGGVTGQGSADYTTITVVDRNEAAIIWQQTPMEMFDYENILRQIKGVMFQERYGIGLINGGRAASVAKNVRIDRNYEPAFAITTY